MRVLVACEESQAIVAAFRKKGHEAYSCDLQDCSGGNPEWHIKGDVMNVINQGWDLMIGHPPCTFLSYAGNHVWNKPGRLEKRLEALDFFAKLWNAPIERICLENPKGCASPTIAKWTQTIQPYYFGDPFVKTTWLWLKNLPMLEYCDTAAQNKPAPIYVDKKGKNRHFSEAITGDEKRSKKRSKTFPGIATAMAEQWG